MQSHIGYICANSLQCEFSNVSSNYLHELMQSRIVYIGMIVCPSEHSNVSSRTRSYIFSFADAAHSKGADKDGSPRLAVPHKEDMMK